MKKSHKDDWHNLAIGLSMLGGLALLMVAFIATIGWLVNLSS